jgi:hypothetical protein
LYEPAPEREPGQVGRPRLKGKRLPTPAQVLEDPQTEWQTVHISNWYGQGPRTVEITTNTAVWYHSGKPPVPIRWVLIRGPKGEFEPQALLSTDQTAPAQQILQWFLYRWQVEVTFQEVRTHLGVETQRQWSDKAIARTTPVLLGLLSWVTLAGAIREFNLQPPAPVLISVVGTVPRRSRHRWSNGQHPRTGAPSR